MKEYIFQLNDALYNEETGEIFKPIVVGELIRCKDCKYYNGEYKYCVNDIFVKPNGYCSYGERRSKVDAELVRHGHWDIYYNDNIPYTLKCSECGEYTLINGKYCPNCGAKMDFNEVEE